MLNEVQRVRSLLVVSRAQDGDAGEYECVAVNEVAKTYSRPARLDVLGKGEPHVLYACNVHCNISKALSMYTVHVHV